MIKKQYLIVDDEELLAQLLVENFTRKNIGATYVQTPQEALDSIALLQPQLVISDYHMPQMTGMALYKETRSRGYHMPFIFMTGRIFDKRLHAEAAELGISLADIVQKPFSLSQIDAKVEEALKKEQYRLEGLQPSGSS